MRSVAASQGAPASDRPWAGDLQIGGRGFAAFKRQTTTAGSVAFTLALRAGAERKRRRFGIFRTEAEVLFRSAAGSISRASVALDLQPRRSRGKR